MMSKFGLSKYGVKFVQLLLYSINFVNFFFFILFGLNFIINVGCVSKIILFLKIL